MRRIILGLAFMASLVLLYQREIDAKERAEDNYKTYCWQCHGMAGNGQGINVRDMSVQPRDHTDAKHMSSLSDEEIFKAIKKGGESVQKSVLMPPWGDTFTDEESFDLVQYLRSLCRCQFRASGREVETPLHERR